MKFTKHLKNRVLLSCLFFMLSFVCSYGQASQKTHQTFISGDAESIRVKVEGADVQLKETKGTRILVETKVTLSVPNEALLNFVIESGRYNLVQVVDPTTRQLTLEKKKSINALVVKGEECEEHITYVVYVPTSIRSFKD